PSVEGPSPVSWAILARRGDETANSCHQPCPVGRLELQPQSARSGGVFDILRTQVVSVNDEWDRTCSRVLPKAPRQIQRCGWSGAVEFCRDDRGALLQEADDVEFLCGDRRHAEPGTGEQLRVLMLTALVFD